MIELFICYLLDPTSSWIILLGWSFVFSGPSVQGKLRYHHWPLNTSSILLNFGSRSGYRLNGNHRSDPSVRTKLNDFLFDIIIAWSSCSTSFFTDVTGFLMCLIWKDHPMASIFVLYMLVSRRWITECSSKKIFHISFWLVVTSIL
jgi:hypothetical protein